MGSIKLSRARLCIDCSVVYDDQSCPYCGSEIGFWIVSVLEPIKGAQNPSDRPTVETPKQEAK